MSVNGLKPVFKTLEGYRSWKSQWRQIYKRMSKEIQDQKESVKDKSRGHNLDEAKTQKALFYKRRMAHKMMTLLDDAKARWNRVQAMKASLDEQNAKFPLELKDCRTIDFHFNKISLEYPEMPMWTVKTKGHSFYVNHIDANVPWSTRETPEGSTKGSIRFRNCNLLIDKEGHASIKS